MDSALNNPHDKFFRYVMSDKGAAQEFFRHHLPADIQSLINFNTLQFCKESFTDEQLKTSSADVLYQVQINQSDAYLYVLVEHQSTIDGWIALRLWNYMLRILDHHRKQYRENTLPVIFPLIFYNGEGEYHKSTHFFDLFGKHKEVALKIYTEPFLLINVEKIPDEELKQYSRAGVAEFVMKRRFVGDFLVFAEEAMRWIYTLKSRDGFDCRSAVIEYIMKTNDGSREQLVEIAQRISPELGEETMTLAQRLAQEGFQKGMKKGMQQGTQQGIFLVAKRMLERGLTVEAVAEFTGLTVVQVKELQETEKA